MDKRTREREARVTVKLARACHSTCVFPSKRTSSGVLACWRRNPRKSGTPTAPLCVAVGTSGIRAGAAPHTFGSSPCLRDYQLPSLEHRAGAA